MKTILLLITLALASGCITAGRLAKELSKDNATVSVRVTTIYGTVQVFRSNPLAEHSVTFDTDGRPIIESK